MDDGKLTVLVGVAIREGSASAILLRFDDGVTFTTNTNLLWCAQVQKAEVVAQVRTLLDKLEALGATVVGRENLDVV